jgi:hypothetical protein
LVLKKGGKKNSDDEVPQLRGIAGEEQEHVSPLWKGHDIFIKKEGGVGSGFFKPNTAFF